MEPWVYGGDGNHTLKAIKEALALRRSLLPYLKEQLEAQVTQGVPVMRPLFFDFSSDPLAATVEDQFMWGPGYMVALVLEQGATERGVYLPSGASFKDYFTGDVFEGGKNVTVKVPSLSYFPFFSVTRD